MTTERRALDLLLSRYPDFDLVKIDWQSDIDGGMPGVWLLVVLGQRGADGSEVWARHYFAIFKRTGDVFGIQTDGAVTDEPLFVVE